MVSVNNTAGRMIFSLPFAVRHEDVIQALEDRSCYADEIGRDYGITDYGSVEVGFPEVLPFYGHGRWSFMSSLEDWCCFFVPTSPRCCIEPERALFEALCKEGSRKKNT